jgi:arginase
MLKTLALMPLAEDRVILADARDLDPGEKKLIEAANIIHLPDVKSLLDTPLPDGSLYVHIDMDIVNPAEASAMNYLAAGGPSATELQSVMKHLSRTEKIAAVSVSTWNPKMDKNGQSRKVCLGLLNTLIGNEKK